MTDQSATLSLDKYIFKTKAYGVRPKSAQWYVWCREAYIARCPNIRLSQHSAFRLEQYLAEKCDLRPVQGWPFQQIIQTLEVLFVAMVNPGISVLIAGKLQ